MDVRPVILAAGARLPVKVPGRFFMLIAAPSPLTVRFKRSLSTFREVARNVEAGYVSMPGDWADQDDRFDGVEFESPVAQTITIGISDRAADYRRTVGIVQIEQPNTIVTAPDVAMTTTTALIIAANGNRKKLIVMNVGANPIRIGETGITATRGIRLTTGQSATIDSTAELRGRTETLTSSVAVLEETRV